MLGALASRPDADQAELAEITGFSKRTAGRLLNLITECAAEQEGPTVERVLARAEAYRSIQKSRIEMMRGYAETRRCRRAYLLQYFGERDPRRCGDCDNCRDGSAKESTAEPEAGEFAIEDRVRHAQFGDGEVMSLEGDEITVLFDDVGYRTLSLPAVMSRRLLTPVG